MRQADTYKLSVRELADAVRHLALLVSAFRSGERHNADDRAIETFRRRIDKAEEWLTKHGLQYGAKPAVPVAAAPEIENKR